MPIYSWKCGGCGKEYESFEWNTKKLTRSVHYCPECGKVSTRDFSKENVTVKPDFEPHFNESLGTHISSRRQWREELAKNDAYDPDLFMNDTPSGGRITKEERVAENIPTSAQERLNRLHRERRSPEDSGIEVEGDANYREVIEYAKRRSQN